jgi:hypothetical protein
VTPPARLRVTPVTPSGSVDTFERAEGIRRLVSAVVPGSVDFSGSEPAPSALPLYRHPADRNAVGTTLAAGRVIDVQG